MKGIIKYNGKYYKKSKETPVEGDLIKLECRRSSFYSKQYAKYDGIYVVDKFNSILVPIEKNDGEPHKLCIKLNYNVLKGDYHKLVEVK